MPGYSSKAQPYLDVIAEAVFQSVEVRDWLIRGTPAEAHYRAADVLVDEQRAVRWRSRKTTQPFWANYFCGRDAACTCRIQGSRALETDAMFFLRNGSGRVLAIHIEFKHPYEAFQFGQPEGYPLRAECFARTYQSRPTINAHQDWATVLFCGGEALADPRVKCFQRVITHDEAAGVIPGWPTFSAPRARRA